MISPEKLQQTMYSIFNETDAVRDRTVSEIYNTAESIPDVSIAAVCKISGKLLFTRIMEATTSEECRGYITELVTVLAIHRAELDAAQGL